MNIDQLLAAFISAGVDTPDKVTALLSDLSIQLQIKRINIELDGLGEKQATLVQPLQDRRTELLNLRADLTTSLTPKS